MSDPAFTPAQEKRLRAMILELMPPLIEQAIQKIADNEVSLLLADIAGGDRGGGGLPS